MARPTVECPLCDRKARSFKPYGHGARRTPNRCCRRCGSLERHRAAWLYLRDHTDLLTTPARLLHVAPEPIIERQLRDLENIEYLSGDLDGDNAMIQMDITDIDRPDNSFDVIYASHVLEHVPDDVAAMGELHRVLRPGGWAILQVPMWGKRTREDVIDDDDDERAAAYGQPDHVRMYGHDGIYGDRLRSAGFRVEVIAFVEGLDDQVIARYGLRPGEDLYRCTPQEEA